MKGFRVYIRCLIVDVDSSPVCNLIWPAKFLNRSHRCGTETTAKAVSGLACNKKRRRVQYKKKNKIPTKVFTQIFGIRYISMKVNSPTQTVKTYICRAKVDNISVLAFSLMNTRVMILFAFQIDLYRQVARNHGLLRMFLI